MLIYAHVLGYLRYFTSFIIKDEKETEGTLNFTVSLFYIYICFANVYIYSRYLFIYIGRIWLLVNGKILVCK